MQIKIPRRAMWLWDGFGDWGNVPVAKFGRYEMLRIDILIGLGIVPSLMWGYYSGGGWGLLGFALAYVMAGMIAVWF